MRYEYGAMVNVPSKKAPAGSGSPWITGNIDCDATAGVPCARQDRGAMVAF